MWSKLIIRRPQNDCTQERNITLSQERVTAEFHLDHLLHIVKPFEQGAYTHKHWESGQPRDNH